MKKKKSRPSPNEYRLIYRINGAEQKSTQYYSGFHSSEVLESLAHAFRKGRIHGGKLEILELEILEIEERKSFDRGWECRKEEAAEQTKIPELAREGDRIYFRLSN